MSVAIRSIVRVQDADDAPALGASQDGYALTWDNASGAFVATALSAGVTDHGALTGLADDDHSQYLLATGARTGASSQAQTFISGIIGPSWKPASDSTTALQVQDAAGTSDIVTVDTTSRRLNINAAASNAALSIQPYSADDSNVYLRNSSGTLVGAITTGASSVSFFGHGSADFQFVTASSKALIFKQIAGSIAFRDYQDYEAARITDAEWVFNNNANPSFDVRIRGSALSHLFFADGSANKIGIGASSPDTILHVQLDDTATNAASQLLTLSHNTSGTVANGFGSRMLWELESSTTADQSAAALNVTWYDATHATRKADLVLTAYDSGGEREGLRIRGDGSGPALGFYGVAPIARAVLATGAGATVDNVITALQNLGLVKQS